MSIGLIGRKCGMTRVFCEDGSSVPVTVLQVDSNRVTQVKSLEVDGYRSIQVAAGDKKSSRVNKALAGHYASSNTTAGRGLWEFRLEFSEGLFGESVRYECRPLLSAMARLVLTIVLICSVVKRIFFFLYSDYTRPIRIDCLMIFYKYNQKIDFISPNPSSG